MNVYVETNFVLELALLQEQYASCEKILGLCEERRAQLVLPAYSLAEPYETLTRRQKQRQGIGKELDTQIKQIARTATYADKRSGFLDLTALLIQSADEEVKRLGEVRSRLLETAEVVPLDASVLVASADSQRLHGFSPKDALVYASVLSHLQRVRPPQSYFLNRDSKDFADQNVVDQLDQYSCTFLSNFDKGYQCIRHALQFDE